MRATKTSTMDLTILSSASSTFLAPPSKFPPPPTSLSTPNFTFRVSALRTDDKPKSHHKEQLEKPLVPPSPSVPAFLCNALEDIINNFIDPPVLRPAVDPRHVLTDNFAPVDELPPTQCPVVRGEIPQCLVGGAYIRNGPNPQHLPRGPHHLFDGDGMLHSLLLSAGPTATLSSRYVHTYKYRLERAAGSPVLPSTFAGFHGAAGLARGAVAGARVLTGQLNPLEGIGLANTSLAFFGGRLYALGESDLPYEVLLSPETGDVTTVGRSDFDGKLFMGMTAHPKLHPTTGELFAFRYGPVPPFVSYFRFDAMGKKAGDDVPIFSVRTPSFLHDFAITGKFAVFADIQIVMKPMEMLVGNGAPVGSDASKVPRVGVLPLYAESESDIKWFDVSGFNPVHIVNAWDDGDDVVVVAPNILSVENTLERMDLVHSCVEMVRIKVRAGGEVTRVPLSAENLDFGVINPSYVGRKTRFFYLGIGNPMPKISGVVKLDVGLAGKGDCVVGRRDFGPGRFGGEPYFVAREEGGEEDDGYLMSYVHDEGSGESSFVVMDAKSPELEVIAEVALPRRVPYGFHGIFVTEAQLRAQRSR